MDARAFAAGAVSGAALASAFLLGKEPSQLGKSPDEAAENSLLRKQKHIGDALASAGLSPSQSSASSLSLAECRLSRAACLLSGSVYKGDRELESDLAHYYFGVGVGVGVGAEKKQRRQKAFVKLLAREQSWGDGGARFAVAFLAVDGSGRGSGSGRSSGSLAGGGGSGGGGAGGAGASAQKGESFCCRGCKECLGEVQWVIPEEEEKEEEEAAHGELASPAHITGAPLAVSADAEREEDVGEGEQHTHDTEPEAQGWTVLPRWLRRNNNNGASGEADGPGPEPEDELVAAGGAGEERDGKIDGEGDSAGNETEENAESAVPGATAILPVVPGERFMRQRECDRGIMGDSSLLSEEDLLDGVYRRSDCIFIAIRGSTTLGDWTTNVTPMSLRQMLPARLAGSISNQTRYGVTVHSAYFARAQAILADIEQADARHRAAHDGAPLLNRSRPLVICGHSMGGAVAALLSVLITDEWHWPSPVRVFSFGSPAFGGEGLRRLSALQDIVRFVAPGDLAPTMCPPGYEHAGRTVALAASPRRFTVVDAHSAIGRAHASAGGKIAGTQLAFALGASGHSIVGYRDRICATLDELEKRLALLQSRLHGAAMQPGRSKL